MFFFILFIVFLVVITRHFASEYRTKAIQTGEADLSPADRSILPFCGIGKVFSVIVFIVMLLTGVFLWTAQSADTNFFSLTKREWSEILAVVATMFVALIVFMTYVHWNWVRRSVLHKARTDR